MSTMTRRYFVKLVGAVAASAAAFGIASRRSWGPMDPTIWPFERTTTNFQRYLTHHYNAFMRSSSSPRHITIALGPDEWRAFNAEMRVFTYYRGENWQSTNVRVEKGRVMAFKTGRVIPKPNRGITFSGITDTGYAWMRV